MSVGFVPPPYPYDRLDTLRQKADELRGGAVDMSIGTPCDPPPSFVVEALAAAGNERGYPPSVGTPQFRAAASAWLKRRFELTVAPDNVAACVGTKEFVASLPGNLKLRSPDRDTVLFPAVSYPSYAMGATLAGCRAVPVDVDAEWRIDLGSIRPQDADRALCLWVNTPGNPAGGLDDLAAIVDWGRSRGIPVFSDECYIEFTWDDPHPRSGAGQPGRSVLEHGVDGVVAVHSLSKRSNLAGVRAGFYAGDPALVGYLSEVRKHAGLMVPGPVQSAAVAAWGDDAHVDAQRRTYHERLEAMVDVLGSFGMDAEMPGGGFYLWVGTAGADDWEVAGRLAAELGLIASPGEFYGPRGVGHLRLAMVQPDDRIELLAKRAAGR